LAFNGIHTPTLDAKNRLTVPARFRPQLQAGGATITKGFEQCLQVWPTAVYDEIAQRAMAGINPFSPEARELNRHLFGNSQPTELDSAGRLGFPAPFLQFAGITKDLVVVGAGQYFEVWDRERWQAYDAELISRAAEHIASVGHPA
jgi:MraZ protein